MKNKNPLALFDAENFNDIRSDTLGYEVVSRKADLHTSNFQKEPLPEILFISSYPPRECGIATYSQDLAHAIENKFGHSLSVKFCALESPEEKFIYNEEVCYTIDTSVPSEYILLADKINQNRKIRIVIVQHEFGFFQLNGGNDFLQFLRKLIVPVVIVFHTVLPRPDNDFKIKVKNLAYVSKSIVVMTNTSKGVLAQDYNIPIEKIEVIAHGTHLVSNDNKGYLKKKYELKGHKILSTFGLMSSGKGIETTLNALAEIVRSHPSVLFLAIGKTHPGVVKSEGEKYRLMLEELVVSLGLENHVRFVNQYLELPVLLEYLRMTDIYLFTSKDPNQAVSGTFSYAMSCGCPVVSTPIPQARELLDEHTGIIFDFQDSRQLAAGVVRLLNDNALRKNLSLNTLHKIAPTAWENSAIAHVLLFENILGTEFSTPYNQPAINLHHIKKMTTDFGMLQFSKINQPDQNSGYTLDDNARALIAICMHFELTQKKSDLDLMKTYLHFINHCIQPDGRFLNYVDIDQQFTIQNNETNLEDANGRAIWALGYLLSKKDLIPNDLIEIAKQLISSSVQQFENVFSSRAMAFCIKGLYYYNLGFPSDQTKMHIEVLADRLEAMYKHESVNMWKWYESYLTYANSILPEAMLMAWLTIEKQSYLSISKQSFRFLLSQTFTRNEIKVISNKGWLSKGGVRKYYGEQPIDVAYTILALQTFYHTFKDMDSINKMIIAFSWFLGNNHLHQIIYNPCTGGCYDGLEETHVNLNQGAESTLSYLMARLTMEKYIKSVIQTQSQSIINTKHIQGKVNV